MYIASNYILVLFGRIARRLWLVTFGDIVNYSESIFVYKNFVTINNKNVMTNIDKISVWM